MNPTKKTKLMLEILPLQPADKGHKTEHIEHKRQETMMSSKRDEVCVDKDNVLEIIDERLAVQEVIADGKKVPTLKSE